MPSKTRNLKSFNIFSTIHRGWWSDPHGSITDDIDRAATFTHYEAVDHCAMNWTDGLPDNIPVGRTQINQMTSRWVDVTEENRLGRGADEKKQARLERIRRRKARSLEPETAAM